MRTSSLVGLSSSPAAPAKARRGHQPRIIVATAMLTLLAVATGSAIALTSGRPPAATPTRSAASSGAATPATPTTPATPAALGPGTPSAAGPVASQMAQVGTGAAPVDGAALVNGTYNAFIRRIDADRRTMLVDVIQVFAGQAAPEAAAEDNRSASFIELVKGSGIYIRNVSARLRSLPVARAATIEFLHTCEGPTATRQLLTELAKNATTSEGFYYSLKVTDGSVRRIVEHQSQPAC
jgi:hypothetical protein